MLSSSELSSFASLSSENSSSKVSFLGFHHSFHMVSSVLDLLLDCGEKLFKYLEMEFIQPVKVMSPIIISITPPIFAVYLSSF